MTISAASDSARSLTDPRIQHWLKGQPRQNFGDYLSELMAVRMLRYPKVEADAYHLIGSVIDDSYVRRELLQLTGTESGTIAYWGCGVRSEEGLSPSFRKSALLFGVRGPISRTALKLPEDTVLGDPALLLPLIHRPDPAVDTAGRSICIPHMLDDRDDAELLALGGADMVVRPIVDGDFGSLHHLLDRIIAADFVLTASLHGAIVAFAFGRPFALWENGHLDLPLKWRDFALSVGFEATFQGSLREGRDAYAEFAPGLKPLPLVPLLEVCPFAVRHSVLLRAFVADGHISAEAAAAAIDLLAAADTREDATTAALLVRSVAHRHAHARLPAALTRVRSRALAVGKRRLKQLLYQA
jgi:hypothetical protein